MMESLAVGSEAAKVVALRAPTEDGKVGAGMSAAPSDGDGVYD